ncbi:MAG: hypothetical protein ACI9VM_000825 [Candidatus Azotimanducaceae bacterium]|jgi:hypothetical protein
MIDKKNILQMVRHVTRHTQGHEQRRLVDPRREWFLGICVFIIIATMGSVLNAKTHVKYNSLESTIVSTNASMIKYDEAAATAAIDLYTQKLSLFDELAADVPDLPVEETIEDSEESEPEESDDEILGEKIDPKPLTVD